MYLCVFKLCDMIFSIWGVFMTTVLHSSSYSLYEYATIRIYIHSSISYTQIPYRSHQTNGRKTHQMRSLHMLVSLIIDKNKKNTKDVKITTNKKHMDNIKQILFGRFRSAISQEQRMQHIVHA